MSRSLRLCPQVIAVAALLSSACGGGDGDPPSPGVGQATGEDTAQTAAPKPNLLFITLDTLRTDHVGCYGHTRDTTPNIDKVAAEGVLFEDVCTAAPVTPVSHASMLSGLNPAAHGLTRISGASMKESVSSLAEVLKAEGYTTGAIISAQPLIAAYNLDQGFDTYDDQGIAGSKRAEVRAEETTAKAIAWLEANAKGPFFLWVHYFDPHGTYDPPPPWDKRWTSEYEGVVDGQLDLYSLVPDKETGKLRTVFPDLDEADQRQLEALYDGEIGYTDHHVGRLLDHATRIGVYDNTITTIISDHGDGLGDHGSYAHADKLYDEETALIWICRFPPKLAAGTRVSPMVRGIDVRSTLLELMEIADPQLCEGSSALPLVRGEQVAPRQCLIASLNPLLRRRPPVFALRTDEWKYIYYFDGQQELYRLSSDPGEMNDLARTEVETLAAFRKELAQHVNIAAAPALTRPAQSPGAETEKKLRALGYLE